MIRLLYQSILWMHPRAFRRRFSGEMLSIFDEISSARFALGLLLDGLASLARQWVCRTDVSKVLVAICGGFLQFLWFFYGRKGHQNWTENQHAFTPHMQGAILATLAVVCGLFLAIVSLAVWTTRFQRRKLKPRRLYGASLVIALVFAFNLKAQQPLTKEPDRSPHTVQLTTVDNNVKLEVLDWGGKGRALVFLAGSGFDAHVFDEFAPKFTAAHHVYGITRRGFGASSAPEPANDNYSADRLGDDVLAVMSALKLDRPVLVGHSLAGEEMSFIGSRHPEKVAGLIYLDAGYSYAFYTPQIGDPIIDAVDLNDRLNKFLSRGFQDSKELHNLQQAAGQLNQDLQALEKQRSLMPPQPSRPADAPPPPAIPVALSKGRRKYTEIHVPVLAIFADPHDFGDLYKDDPKAKAAVVANDAATTSAQADAFQAGVPSARVVRIANADHFIFRSNEADVMREMNGFLAALH